MNLARALSLVMLLSLAFGCQREIEFDGQQAEVRLQEDNPFATNDSRGDSTTSTSEDDDPFGDTDWIDLPIGEGGFSFFNTAEFEIGDLVPCDDELAEFSLEIEAMSGRRCFYRRQQSFCLHRGSETDPSDEPGIVPDRLVCAMMVNGFASGTLQYTKLDSQEISVKIEWSASQGENSQRFVGEFDVQPNGTGDVDAGNGNRFVWAFKPVVANEQRE